MVNSFLRGAALKLSQFLRRQALQLQFRKHLLLGGGKNSRALAMLEEISEKQIGLERVGSGEIGIA